MSDFDKEAERERLREKYEREQEKRKSTEQMSELLLKGATMTNAHCNNCGDPIFRYDGEEFCPTCQQPVASPDEAAEASAVDADGEEAGEADAAVEAGEADAAESGADAGTDDGGASTADQSPSAANVDSPTAATGGIADGQPAQVDTNGSDASSADASSADASSADASSADAGSDTPAQHRTDQPEPATASDPTRSPEPAARQEQSPVPDPTTSPQTLETSGEVADELGAARQSLTRTLLTQARQAERCDDPRRAKDHLAAAREAAEALSALSSY